MHYQHLRVQCDTKACYILFIARFTYDVDIQYQLFTVYFSTFEKSGDFVFMLVFLFEAELINWVMSCGMSLMFLLLYAVTWYNCK